MQDLNIVNKTYEKINQVVNKKISKFYPIDKDDELFQNDVTRVVLERLSDDEKPIDSTEFIEDDNKKASYDSVQAIQQQMEQMTQVYTKMAGSMESNLILIQEFVKQLQQSESNVDKI